MRKFITVAVLILIFPLFCQAQKQPVIDFDSYRFNLGTLVKKDAVRTHVFKFKNTGDAKLVIDHLNVGCPCTVAKYSKKTFLPGESGEIVVTYDGTHQSPGSFEIETIVASNASYKYVRLTLAGKLVNTQEEALASQQPQKSVDTTSTKKQESWFKRLKRKASSLFKSD
jgi:hypothetical protein